MAIGLAALAGMAFEGADMGGLWRDLLARTSTDPSDAAAAMDLATLALLFDHRELGLQIQAQALDRTALYRRPSAKPGARNLRLLAFMAPGDLMVNAPLEFLLAGSSVTLDLLYVRPGQALPGRIPAHDVAMVAIGESDETRPLLYQLGRDLRDWPQPVLNLPDHIARLSRVGTWRHLKSVPGLVVPKTIRADRIDLTRVAIGALSLPDLFAGLDFPVIIRPVGSHAGAALNRLETPADLGAYLAAQAASTFYVASFIDYRSTDGLYRKYRVVLIDGRAYACHMAISSDWMIHYLNADMRESVAKRAEEARFMATFDEGFARRHDGALAGLVEQAGLDYVAMDCGETPDGKLLMFEIDVPMIVHAMDPPDLFPYKRQQMTRVFGAFQAMLRRRARVRAAVRA